METGKRHWVKNIQRNNMILFLHTLLYWLTTPFNQWSYCPPLISFQEHLASQIFKIDSMGPIYVNYSCWAQCFYTVAVRSSFLPFFFFEQTGPNPSSIHMDLAASVVWLRLAPQARLVRSVSKNHSTHRTVGGRELSISMPH
jgi:hypothetical protein